ncbi:hypothetical protein EUGRSUZ_F00107 [Eucalyptus grandis]|uniref:Uncharacterized protein n=2 Tax=Eucalyptus grandis TaxID=71139 RepID=A0ACC3KA66_EUCGR|nr:hypothetical protein EUGRSUZ_F00107 [Eucalyptus grandis]
MDFMNHFERSAINKELDAPSRTTLLWPRFRFILSLSRTIRSEVTRVFIVTFSWYKKAITSLNTDCKYKER